jgi:hypothetical protein
MIECFLPDWKQGVYSMPKFLFHQALEVNNLPTSKITQKQCASCNHFFYTKTSCLNQPSEGPVTLPTIQSDLLVNNHQQQVTTGLCTVKMLAKWEIGNNSDKSIINFWTLQSDCKVQTTCYGSKSKWEMFTANKQEIKTWSLNWEDVSKYT